MCGRFSQRAAVETYVAKAGWKPARVEVGDGLKYNVPPGTCPIVLHRLGNGRDQVDRLFWGYKPRWYWRGPEINARLDKILKKSRMWRSLLNRRVIVPVDGWFEWPGNQKRRQPWYIHAKDGEPIFFAAITAWEPGENYDVKHGFVIVTNDAVGPMHGRYKRRPMALTPDAVREWTSPDVSVEAALELLSTARPETAFEWHPVTPQMNNAKYQAPNANYQIAD